MLMIIISRHPPHTLPPTDSQYYHLGLNILRINSVNVRTFHLIRRKLKPIINLKLILVSGMKCTAVGLETWSDDNGNKIMTGEMTDMRLQIQIATLSFSLRLNFISNSQHLQVERHKWDVSDQIIPTITQLLHCISSQRLLCHCPFLKIGFVSRQR